MRRSPTAAPSVPADTRSHPPTAPNAERRGKGSTVAFLEFDTVAHAAAALDRLAGLRVNTIERVAAAYAPQPKGWHASGGRGGRDHGGAPFAFGLTGGGDGDGGGGDGTARRDEETRLFRDVQRRSQWGHLERIAHYLRRPWIPGDRTRMRCLVREPARRRLAEEDPAGANAAAVSVPPHLPSAEPTWTEAGDVAV